MLEAVQDTLEIWDLWRQRLWPCCGSKQQQAAASVGQQDSFVFAIAIVMPCCLVAGAEAAVAVFAVTAVLSLLSAPTSFFAGRCPVLLIDGSVKSLKVENLRQAAEMIEHPSICWESTPVGLPLRDFGLVQHGSHNDG